MKAQCNIPNCRKLTPDTEAFCSDHRNHGTALFDAAAMPIAHGELADIEDFAPCPTCKQYSHSLGKDKLAEAYLHFHTMEAHPVRGHPMDHLFDEKTRDMVSVVLSALRQTNAARSVDVNSEINALKDALAQAEGIIAELEARLLVG